MFVANTLYTFFLLCLSFLCQIFHVSQRLTTKKIPFKLTNIDDITTKKLLNTIKNYWCCGSEMFNRKNTSQNNFLPLPQHMHKCYLSDPLWKSGWQTIAKSVQMDGSTVQSWRRIPWKGMSLSINKKLLSKAKREWPSHSLGFRG